MSITTLEKVFLGVGIISLSGIFTCVGISLYIAHTKMNTMLAIFKNSPFVMNRSLLLGCGTWGKLFVLGGITEVLVRPRLFLRDGGVSADDLARFPEKLKRQLIILRWSMLPFAIAFFGMCLLIEFNII